MSEVMTWLREKEAAARLRIHVDTLREMRRQGRGPKWGRAVRVILYRPEDLDAWVEARGDVNGAE